MLLRVRTSVVASLLSFMLAFGCTSSRPTCPPDLSIFEPPERWDPLWKPTHPAVLYLESSTHVLRTELGELPWSYPLDDVDMRFGPDAFGAIAIGRTIHPVNAYYDQEPTEWQKAEPAAVQQQLEGGQSPDLHISLVRNILGTGEIALISRSSGELHLQMNVVFVGVSCGPLFAWGKAAFYTGNGERFLIFNDWEA